MPDNKLFHRHNKGSLAKIFNFQGWVDQRWLHQIVQSDDDGYIKDDYIKQCKHYNDDSNGVTKEQEQFGGYRIATQLLNIIATI